MSLARTFAAVVLAGSLSVPAQANVVRLEVTAVEPAGPDHERISGKIHGEVDPADPKNAGITDIDLAPRNARGTVEYIATFSLVKPKDMTKASGVLLYTVVNRGGSSADAAPVPPAT